MAPMADPSRILQTGFGFWNAKVLLTAIKLEVFTVFGEKAMTGAALGTIHGCDDRHFARKFHGAG
jgi:hypothetical protein